MLLFSTRYNNNKIITHIAKTIGFLASQIVYNTLAGIEAGTAVVKRSTRAQVPKTYFIYYTFWRIPHWMIIKTVIVKIILVVSNLSFYEIHVSLDNYRNDYGV